jgi:DNA-directed RNA polymerase specialized sigma24 family protein
LNQQKFDEFLTLFDADRERACSKLEFIYADLIQFFQNQKKLRHPPTEYAVETIIRVAERNEDSKEIKNLRQFIFGVAWNVLHESQRGELLIRKLVPLENFPESKMLSKDSEDDKEEPGWRLWKRRRLRCMKQCAENLPSHEYDLLQKYAQSNKQGREALAKQLGITIDSLRLRVYHIRERLKACRAGCLKKSSEKSQ